MASDWSVKIKHAKMYSAYRKMKWFLSSTLLFIRKKDCKKLKKDPASFMKRNS